MVIENLGAGSVATADLRGELAGSELPDDPHFVVRASISGPLALTTLALDLSLLVPPVVSTNNGWLVKPINKPLVVGQRLGWSVFAGFQVPRVASFLVINNRVRFLGRKDDLAAGGLWAARVVLRTHHLSP